MSLQDGDCRRSACASALNNAVIVGRIFAAIREDEEFKIWLDEADGRPRRSAWLGTLLNCARVRRSWFLEAIYQLYREPPLALSQLMCFLRRIEDETIRQVYCAAVQVGRDHADWATTSKYLQAIDTCRREILFEQLEYLHHRQVYSGTPAPPRITAPDLRHLEVNSTQILHALLVYPETLGQLWSFFTKAVVRDYPKLEKIRIRGGACIPEGILERMKERLTTLESVEQTEIFVPGAYDYEDEEGEGEGEEEGEEKDKEVSEEEGDNGETRQDRLEVTEDASEAPKPKRRRLSSR